MVPKMYYSKEYVWTVYCLCKIFNSWFIHDFWIRSILIHKLLKNKINFLLIYPFIFLLYLKGIL